MTYMATPQRKNPCPGSHEIYNLVEPSLVIISIYLVCLIYAWEYKEKNNAFYYTTYLATPQHKNPLPGGHEIYNFGTPFLGHPYYIHSLSDLCIGVEKKIFKEIMFFHYMTYMATPQGNNPCPGGHEIYNCGRPYLGHHYYILSLSDLCLGVEKKIFKEIHQFYTFYPKITSLWE